MFPWLVGRQFLVTVGGQIERAAPDPSASAHAAAISAGTDTNQAANRACRTAVGTNATCEASTTQRGRWTLVRATIAKVTVQPMKIGRFLAVFSQAYTLRSRRPV
jgi:hypothetical protein